VYTIHTCVRAAQHTVFACSCVRVCVCVYTVHTCVCTAQHAVFVCVRAHLRAHYAGGGSGRREQVEEG
jgi:hypothetical protein